MEFILILNNLNLKISQNFKVRNQKKKRKSDSSLLNYLESNFFFLIKILPLLSVLLIFKINQITITKIYPKIFNNLSQ